MVSALSLLNVSVVCVFCYCFLFFDFLFASVYTRVYMIVYACAGALRTSLLLELIDKFLRKHFQSI